MLSGEEAFILFGNRSLRAYLLDIARSFSRRPGDFKDLYAVAWVRIDRCGAGKTDEHYMNEGFHGMYAWYMANIKAPDYWPRKPASDKAVQRVHKTTKRFFKRLMPNGGVHLPPIL